MCAAIQQAVRKHIPDFAISPQGIAREFMVSMYGLTAAYKYVMVVVMVVILPLGCVN